MDSECMVITVVYSEHTASLPCSTPWVFYIVCSVLVCWQQKIVKQKMRCLFINRRRKLWRDIKTKRHKITGPTARTTCVLNCFKSRTQSNRTELIKLTDWMTYLPTYYLPTNWLSNHRTHLHTHTILRS
jgi:hypothetical protein